jgi:hypothetical protein
MVIYASLIPWALRIDRTLWFTFNIGIPNIIKDTSTRGCSSLFRALSISSAW